MKDLRSPPITPGLNHSPAFPMQDIGDQKTRSIGQVLSFMYDHQALASIPLQPDHLGEGQEHFLLAVTAAHLDLPETLWVVLSQLGSHFIHAPPVPRPLNRPRNLHLTGPMPYRDSQSDASTPTSTPPYQKRSGPGGTGLQSQAGARSPRRSPSVCGTPTDVYSSVTTPARFPH